MRPQFQIQVSEPSPQGDVAYTRLISQLGREPRATKGYPDILF